MDKNILFTSDESNNWLYKKYWYAGANLRYHTFQAALNLLHQQKGEHKIIIETGCQRQKDDIGAGMSTSIFGEYLAINHPEGLLYTVDNCERHLDICKECTEEYRNNIYYVLSDSISFLKEPIEIPNLLYLDSLDYPIGEQSEDVQMRDAAQFHCLNEFKSIEDRLYPDTILLADDNQLPGGGKPKLLKEYLLKRGWKCILDFQQSLWVKKL